MSVRFLISSLVLSSAIALQADYSNNGLANLAVRPKTQDGTFRVFGDALYYHTSEIFDWAYTRSGNSTTFETDYKILDFNWAPGFSVGLGYNMVHDNWDTQLQYTWFQSNATGAASGVVIAGFLAARLSLLEPFTTGNAALHLDYNMFDWDLGRSFFVSEFLSLRPTIGLKGGWINQNLNTTWTIPDFFFTTFLLSATENLKQRFQCGGPKGGFTANWILANFQQHFFSIVSHAEAGFLWGHWSIQDQYTDNLSTDIAVITTDRNFGAFVLQGFLGLGWDCNFNDNRFHVQAKIGYQIEDWLNQLQIYTNISGSQNNDLILQGLNFSLGFDF